MKPYHNNTIPLEAQYLYLRGLEMISQQRTDTALIYFRQAVIIAQDFLKAYRELGNGLARLGRSEEASAYRIKASWIDPIQSKPRVDAVTMKRQDENPSMHVHILTCLVW